MYANCQDCAHNFLITPDTIVSGACPRCGGKRLERDQPSPLHSDGELRNMVDMGTGKDMGGNPLMEGSLGGWKPFGQRDESFASVKKHAYGGADTFVQCDQGHTHWGAAGAAGLMLSHNGQDGQTRYLLQHRSPYVDHPNTWSTPGGALDHGETPQAGAVRETEEEMGQLPPHQITHVDSDDHGNWAYHTVHGRVADQFVPQHLYDEVSGGAEGQNHGWFTPNEIDQLPLHPGFAGSWARNRHMFAKVAAQPIGDMMCPTCGGDYNRGGDPNCLSCHGLGWIDTNRNADGPFINMHDQSPGAQGVQVRSPGEYGEPSAIHEVPYSIDPRSLRGRLPLVPNGYDHRNSMQRHLNMDPYAPLWSDEFGEQMEKEAAMALPLLAPLGEALGIGGAEAGAGALAGGLMKKAVPWLMRGALMGTGSNLIGGLGGGGQQQEPQIAPPRPDTVFSHTAGESDISSGDLSNPGYYQHDDAADADQHQFMDQSTDTNMANPNADVGGGVGGATTDNPGNEGHGTDEAGIGPDKPSFADDSPGVQRAQMILPMLLDYHGSPDSGANDPIIRELHEILEKENPGYLNDVGMEHAQAWEELKNHMRSPDAVHAKTAGPFDMAVKGLDWLGKGVVQGLEGSNPRCPACGTRMQHKPGSIESPAGVQAQNAYCPRCFTEGTIGPDGSLTNVRFSKTAGPLLQTVMNRIHPPDEATAYMNPPTFDSAAPHGGYMEPPVAASPDEALIQPRIQDLIARGLSPDAAHQYAMAEYTKTGAGFAPGVGMLPGAPGQAAPTMQPGGGLPGVGQQGQCPYCGGMQHADGSCPQCGAKAPPGGQQTMMQQPTSAPPEPGLAPAGVAPTQTVQPRMGADNIAKRCPYCGSGTTGIHDDWSGQAHCHACGKVFDQENLGRGRWANIQVVALDEVTPMGQDNAPPVGVPAADQDQPYDGENDMDSSLTWKDTSGQKLVPGGQYEMHSQQYPVPDIIQVVQDKPDELVFSTIGEQPTPTPDAMSQSAQPVQSKVAAPGMSPDPMGQPAPGGQVPAGPGDPDAMAGKEHRLKKQDADMWGVTFVPLGDQDSNAGEQSLDQYADSGQAPVNTEPQAGVHSHVAADYRDFDPQHQQLMQGWEQMTPEQQRLMGVANALRTNNGMLQAARERALNPVQPAEHEPVPQDWTPPPGYHDPAPFLARTAADNPGPVTPEQQAAVIDLLHQLGRGGEAANVPINPGAYVHEMAQVAGRVNTPPMLPPGQAPTPPPMDPSMMGGMPPGGAPPGGGMPPTMGSVEDDGSCRKCASTDLTSNMIDPNNVEHECYECGEVWIRPVATVESDSSTASRAWLNQDPTDDFAMNMERMAAMRQAEGSQTRNIADIAARDNRLQAIKQRLATNDPIFKHGGANFTSREERDFIEERGTARNSDKLDLSDTHYELKDSWETKGNAGNAPDEHLFLGM